MTTASAPASSANLGPGFDILALALGIRCRVVATPSSSWDVASGGGPASAHTVEMVRRVVGEAAPHAIAIESSIPQARGLGSSAALLVATSAAVVGEVDRDGLFAAAAAVEGHPDNVAAAVYGGLVAAGPDGSVERLGIHPALHVLVAIPNEELSTERAREVLAPIVSRDVAVRTSARLAMLVEGLRTADSGRLRAALGDEIHEGPRASLTATPGRLIETALEAGALFGAWSGAGPSVIAFVSEELVDSVHEALEWVLGPGGSVIEPSIDREGVRLE